MAINLTTKFLPYTDEKFKAESKLSLLTNTDFEWTGAHTVKVYKISTGTMGDYDRNGKTNPTARFGTVADLDASTEEFTLSKDRAFTFAIDKLDNDETAAQLQAASALERQQREVVIPEVDSYVYNVMATNAGTTATAIELTADNIYVQILKAGQTLDDAEVPETERVLILTPAVYQLLKQCTGVAMDNTDISADERRKGVIAMLDGASIVKVPSVRLPDKFGFMLAHPSATVAPVKLEDYRVHQDPPGISGALVEGRIVYDAFVLDNKAAAIYNQPTT